MRPFDHSYRRNSPRVRISPRHRGRSVDEEDRPFMSQPRSPIARGSGSGRREFPDLIEEEDFAEPVNDEIDPSDDENVSGERRTVRLNAAGIVSIRTTARFGKLNSKCVRTHC